MSYYQLRGIALNLRNKRKYSIILVISFFIVISVLLVTVKGDQYTDSDGHYTLRFPSGWEQSEIEGVDVAFLHPQEDEFRENINIVSVSMSKVKNTKEFVIDAADEAISALKGQFSGTTVISEAEAEIIRDHWSATYVLDVKYDWGTLRQSQTIIASQGYSMVFIITCTTSPSTFSSYEPQFIQSVNSFQILNEPEPEEESFMEGFIIVTIAGALIGGAAAFLGGFLIMKKRKKEERAAIPNKQTTEGYNRDSVEDHRRQPPISPPPQPPPPP